MTNFSLDAVPSWVSACAYCRVDLVLPFLAKIAERDTQEMNALPQEIRGASFRFERDPRARDRAFTVTRIEEGGVAVANVMLACTPHAIEIARQERKDGQVEKPGAVLATLSWQAKTHTCLLTIDRQSYTLGAAVEHILKPLFFPRDDGEELT